MKLSVSDIFCIVCAIAVLAFIATMFGEEGDLKDEIDIEN